MVIRTEAYDESRLSLVLDELCEMYLLVPAAKQQPPPPPPHPSGISSFARARQQWKTSPSPSSTSAYLEAARSTEWEGGSRIHVDRVALTAGALVGWNSTALKKERRRKGR